MKKKEFTDEERINIITEIEKIHRKEGISITESCIKVGISNPTFYQWKKKLKSKIELIYGKRIGEELDSIEKTQVLPATKVNEADGKKILEVKASFPHMGVKQLRQHLIRNHRVRYSERQIRQFLESHKVPKIKTVHPPQPVRRFERDLSNEMWQIDIMNFHIHHHSLYLISVMDDYSRFIVSYSITEEQRTIEILRLVRRAVSFRKPLSILTDRGIQFCSWNGVTAFQLELKALKIDHLVAREQHPQTLGKIEAFHKTIQRELLTTMEFSNVTEAKEWIHDYIMFYNFTRPHSGIDNQSPAERYFKNLRPYNLESFYYRKVAFNPKRNRRVMTVEKKEPKRSFIESLD